jgi:transcription antitermination factor NusG
LTEVEEDNKKREATGRKAPGAKREFAVGDRVRIKNPGPFQASTGTIVKIGASRNTVQARNGTKFLRAPKNLSFEE